MYYRGATAAIIVYDVTSKSSFEGAKSWVKELQRRGDPHCVIALAANKADLEGKRKVSVEEGDEYAGSNDIIHLQTSAKTGMNIKNLFVEIARKLPKTKVSDSTPVDPFPVAPSNSGGSGGCAC